MVDIEIDEREKEKSMCNVKRNQHESFGGVG